MPSVLCLLTHGETHGLSGIFPKERFPETTAERNKSVIGLDYLFRISVIYNNRCTGSFRDYLKIHRSNVYRYRNILIIGEYLWRPPYFICNPYIF